MRDRQGGLGWGKAGDRAREGTAGERRSSEWPVRSPALKDTLQEFMERRLPGSAVRPWNSRVPQTYFTESLSTTENKTNSYHLLLPLQSST